MFSQAFLVLWAALVVLPLLWAVLSAFKDDKEILSSPFSLPKTLHWILLREDRLVVLAPEAWAHRDPHALLREEPLIRYDRPLGGGQAAERYLRRAPRVPRERVYMSSLAALAPLCGACSAP